VGRTSRGVEMDDSLASQPRWGLVAGGGEMYPVRPDRTSDFFPLFVRLAFKLPSTGTPRIIDVAP